MPPEATGGYQHPGIPQAPSPDRAIFKARFQALRSAQPAIPNLPPVCTRRTRCPPAYCGSTRMDDPVVNAPGPASPQQPALSLDKVFSIVCESAAEAFVKSILVLIFGSIALGIAGGIWRQMLPSAPPGLGIRPEAEAVPAFARDAWAVSLNQHGLLILFGIIFLPTAGFRLMKRGALVEQSKARSRLQKLRSQLCENWFNLIVGNAFGAFICAVVLTSVQQVDFTKMLLQWVLNSVLSGVQNLAGQVLGPGAGESSQAWLNWYGENQLKFNFWFFYLAAICDDLGIPNLKTLGRWLGRRVRNRKEKPMLPKILNSRLVL